MPPQTVRSDDDNDSDDVEYFRNRTSKNPPTASFTMGKTPRMEPPDLHHIDEIDEALLRHNVDIDDTVEVNAYSLQKIIEEAKSYYGHEKPEFCINKPQKGVKQIKLNGIDEIADIRFHDWSDGLGYWILTDDVGDGHIVKCLGAKYYRWEGVDKGFSRGHVATVFKGSQTSADQTPPNKSFSLRERTVRQFKPYTMYNAQKRYDQKGLRLSETELEEIMSSMSSSPAPKLWTDAKNYVPRSVLTPSSEHNDSVNAVFPDESPSMTDEEIRSKIVIRTRFQGFDRATIPISAQACPSSEVFFEVIKRKWAFKLVSSQLAYCVATFPWLDMDKNILLQEHDEESFNSIMEEVRLAPDWRHEGRVEVIVELCTEV